MRRYIIPKAEQGLSIEQGQEPVLESEESGEDQLQHDPNDPFTVGEKIHMQQRHQISGAQEAINAQLAQHESMRRNYNMQMLHAQAGAFDIPHTGFGGRGMVYEETPRNNEVATEASVDTIERQDYEVDTDVDVISENVGSGSSMTADELERRRQDRRATAEAATPTDADLRRMMLVGALNAGLVVGSGYLLNKGWNYIKDGYKDWRHERAGGQGFKPSDVRKRAVSIAKERSLKRRREFIEGAREVYRAPMRRWRQYMATQTPPQTPPSGSAGAPPNPSPSTRPTTASAGTTPQRVNIPSTAPRTTSLTRQAAAGSLNRVPSLPFPTTAPPNAGYVPSVPRTIGKVQKVGRLGWNMVRTMPKDVAALLLDVPGQMYDYRVRKNISNMSANEALQEIQSSITNTNRAIALNERENAISQLRFLKSMQREIKSKEGVNSSTLNDIEIEINKIERIMQERESNGSWNIGQRRGDLVI